MAGVHGHATTCAAIERSGEGVGRARVAVVIW
jgi:hypothetical protein